VASFITEEGDDLYSEEGDWILDFGDDFVPSGHLRPTNILLTNSKTRARRTVRPKYVRKYRRKP
jgi:hypothetical protein